MQGFTSVCPSTPCTCTAPHGIETERCVRSAPKAISAADSVTNRRMPGRLHTAVSSYVITDARLMTAVTARNRLHEGGAD